MGYKQNLHIHSTYADGKDTPEEMVQEAIKRGFDSIGFSEHSYMYFVNRPVRMCQENMGEYQAEIKGLKEKYKGIIDIFCGMEYEIYSEVPTDEFDYVIGSVHYLKIDGEIVGIDRGLPETLDYIQKYFSGDGMAFAKKYYETMCTLPDKGKFDILGHIDLVTKNNEQGKFIDTSSKVYLQYAYEAIHALKGKIPLFEVNTGAIARGYRTSPYPQMELLKELKKCDFGAVITSDCHDKRFVDCYFEEARQLLTEVGFESQWILTDTGFCEVGI